MSLLTSPPISSSIARPEDRRRSGVDSLAYQGWADTRPGCFRSEGFAEDLQEVAEPPSARQHRADGTLAAWPLLGLTLAGVLSAFGR